MPPKKKAVRRTSSATNGKQDDIKTYRCTWCGREETSPEKKFYKVPYSRSHDGNDNYAHICIHCIKEFMEQYSAKRSQKVAVMACCALLDVPFYRSLYESINKARDDFNFGYYIRQINSKQYQGKTFALTLANGELEVTKKEAEDEAEEMAESNWSVDEKRAKNEVIQMLGYDPFDGYAYRFRRKLFLELQAYLNDEELLSDNYKLAQIIQIINNNHQINQYDIAISKCDPQKDMDEIKTLNALKKELVSSNEKIAKENGISVKSRGDQKAGRGTLTGLMRDMREKDLKEAEVNFYDQLQSENTRWAIDMSMKSMLDNCSFDENDVNDIIEHQRDRLSELQDEADNLKEEKRLLKLQEYELKERVTALENQVIAMGGDVDVGSS